MGVTKAELKGMFKGVLLTTAIWMLVLPLRDWIINISPLKDTAIIGIILLVVVAFWD